MMAGRQPQIAVGLTTAQAHRAAIVCALPEAIGVYLSSDSARRFSPARPILSGKIMAGRHRGPRAAWIDDALVVTAIQGGGIHSWRSSGAGREWVKGAIVNDAPDAAREGLHAMAAGNLGLVCAWLDLRGGATRLFAARSRDGLAWSPNQLVYASPSGNVCECCHPNVQITPDGAIHVMWRNWLNGARDLYLATSADGGASYRTTKLGRGTWPLKSCPMDGGALALPYTAWRRERTVYLCRPGGDEIALGEGKDPALAVDGKATPYVAWTHETHIMVQAGIEGKAAPLAEGSFAQLARIPDGILAAWETRDEPGAIDFARVAG